MSNYSSEDINIVVDSAPQGILGTFVPGQTVSGKVIYTPRGQVDINHVVIICKGINYTKITESNGNTSSTYREKIILFRDLDTIFRGPHTIPAGTYEWPFRFELPVRTDYSRKPRRKDEQYQLGDQDLPPTFKLASSNPEADVTYKLKVKVNPGNFIHTTTRTKELPVWCLSRIPLKPPVPLDSFSEGNGRFKSNSLRPTQHTFKEKMRHAFTSDATLRTPEINISVRFKMPRCVSATQYMPIELACKHTISGQNDPECPELVLDGCTFSLNTYTNVRAKGTGCDHHKSKKNTVVGHSIRGSQTLLPLDGSFVPIWEPIRLADMTSHPHNLVPSFRTWTIAMCYKMVVKIRIRHVQTGHIWKLESKFPFEILPGEVEVPAYSKQPTSSVEAGPSALYPPQLSSENQASSSSAAPPEFREDLAPPSYNSGDVWRTEPSSKRAY
ncbi:hypothetical protein KCU81_g9142, partial [Aureobasidium melanogenum]|uniref:Arrestin-like N-terminal domain-containing protein n=1 Tax=Aureobasidium melanogenum (strain CBS 110374) TaxID=1043003 RepID=A0A074VVA3_AURM1